MKKRTVDARGKACPQPIIMVREALGNPDLASDFSLLTDNQASLDNVSRYLQANHVHFQTIRKENYFELKISAEPGNHILTDEQSCAGPQAGQLAPSVIVFKNDKMGLGNEELGTLLVKAFINTIKELSPLPGKIIFYNRGVFLAASDSTVLPALQELEKSGMPLLLCGTCVQFFQLTGKTGCGTISNMYEIMSSLNQAGKIICP